MAGKRPFLAISARAAAGGTVASALPAERISRVKYHARDGLRDL